MLTNQTPTLWQYMSRTAQRSAAQSDLSLKQKLILKQGRLTKLFEPYAERWARLKIIKITGTNGKGSTAAMVSACVQSAGQKVGLFTSPHLVQITERVRINGQEVTHDLLEEYAQRHYAAVEQMAEQHGESGIPSFFEFLLLVTLEIFVDHGVEVAVIEAGIGGRNDATSLLPGGIAAIITSIGLDHKAQLGNTLTDVARDKTGIVGRNTMPLIVGPGVPADLYGVIRQQAGHCPVSQASRDGLSITAKGLEGYQIAHPDWLHPCHLPLLGEHQIDNFATVVALMAQLSAQNILPREAIYGIQQTRWPGRLERRTVDGVTWLFDVAHNEHAFIALRQSLSQLVPPDRVVVLYGAAHGKDYPKCLPYLPQLGHTVYLLDGFHRAEHSDQIARLLPIPPAGQFADVSEAVTVLNEQYAGQDKVILVAGSVFLVGAVRGEMA